MELEHYFVRRMAAAVNKLGKTTLGWDDIAEAGVAPGRSALLWWHHEKPELLKGGLEKGYPVVLCPRLPCYFDFVQYKTHTQGRTTGAKDHFRCNDLASVYDFPDAAVKGLIPQGKEGKVLGLEACVWSETIGDKNRLAYMIYPRLAAIAEDGWTPAAQKDLADFMTRIRVFLRELDHRRIPYFNPFDPKRTPEPPSAVKEPENIKG